MIFDTALRYLKRMAFHRGETERHFVKNTVSTLLKRMGATERVEPVFDVERRLLLLRARDAA